MEYQDNKLFDGHRPPPRRRRRRLKRSVKLCLVAIVVLLMMVVFRPWRWLGGIASSAASSGVSGGSSALVGADSLRLMSLNFKLTNADSDIPQAERLDRAVRQFMQRWEIRGASLALMKDGNLIFSKGYGFASVEDSIPMDVKHIFRIASVSKLVTAVAVLGLCERGLLRLDAQVFGEQGLLPEYKGYTDRRIPQITVEQLLRHKGGFTVRSGDPMFSPTTMEIARRNGRNRALTTDELVAHCLRQGLGYRPGDRTKYSNLGYVILSQVIERVTGMSYEQYVKDSVLTPVGCHDFQLARNLRTQKYENEVSYYETDDAESVLACDGSGAMVAKCNGGNDVRGLLGAGGWVASPVEVLRFVSAIDGLNRRGDKADILSAAMVGRMTAYSKGELPMGWMKVSEGGEWLRTGSMAGTSAMLKRQRDGYTWFFVTNTSSWKGARFPRIISGMLNVALDRVDVWPEKDLFEE